MKLATFHLTVGILEEHMVVALNGIEVRNSAALWAMIKDSAMPLPEAKIAVPVELSALVQDYANSGGKITILRGVGNVPLPQHSAPRGLSLEDLEIF